jgi:MFS family permease
MQPLSGIQIAFYVLYGVGFILAVGFIIRYHQLTDGAWRKHQTGISYMGDAVSLALVLAAVVGRIISARLLHWHWFDVTTQLLALAGTVGVVGWIGFRWYLLERYQKSDKE